MNKQHLDFSKILGISWEIVKKHPFLWIFGILGGGYGFSLPNFNYNFGGKDFEKFKNISSVKDYFGEVAGVSTQKHLTDLLNYQSIIIIIICALVIFILLLVLGSIFRAGLIKSVSEISYGKQSNFKIAWRQGVDSWLQIFYFQLIMFVIGLILAVPFFLLTWLGMSDSFNPVYFFFLLPWVFIVFIVFFILGIYYPAIERKIVLENLSTSEGIKRGTAFVTNYWKQLLIAELIVIAISIAFMITFFILIMILVLPIVLVVIALWTTLPVIAIVLGIIFGIIGVAIELLAIGILGAYVSTFYTGTYLALSSFSDPKN